MDTKTKKKTFFIYQALLFLGTIPTWLAAWPGFFCYDAQAESYEVMTYKFSNRHPIIHELILGNVLRLGNRLFGSYNAGIVIYVFVQMIIMTAIFAYLLLTLKECKVRKIGIILSGLFLSIFPPVSIYTVCTVKDVLFSGGVVLLFTIALRIEKKLNDIKDKKTLLLIFSAVLLICFFRNNGVYALILFALIALLFHKSFRRALIPIVTGIVLYFVITESLVAALSAKTWEIKELLSVPIQQLARVYVEDRDAYSEKDLEVLYELIPAVILERYNPDSADDVKVNFLEDNYKADKGKFISLWWRTMLKSPGEYAKAFWYMIDSYFYPGAPVVGYEGRQVGEMVYGESAYFQFEIEYPCFSNTLFPAYHSMLKSMSLDIRWQQIPVLSLFLSPASYMWIYLISFILHIISKKKDRVLRYLIPLPILLTVMFGAMALVRYVLYLYLLAPLFIYDIICSISELRQSPSKDRTAPSP